VAAIVPAPDTAAGPETSAAALAEFPFEQLEPSPPLPRDAPDRILALAAAEGECIRERARAEGHAEGRAQGHRDGIAETTAAAHALAQALDELRALRHETAEAVERDAVELALALAAKILTGELDARPERVIDVVRGALRRIGDRRQVVVLVDPGDLDVVSAAVNDLRAQVGGIETCDVQADRRVGRGGAVVRTVEGEIDATVKTQLERARELMLADAPAEQCEGSELYDGHERPDGERTE
jgi:flagellar biosynthesis/type III secretory pathway protein FliH